MTTIGTIELIAKIDTSQYKRGANEIDRANKDMENSGERSSSTLSGSFSKVAKVGLAALATAVVAVGALIASNIGDAVKRVDTLANSARTFENLGFGAKEIKSAMDALDKSIRGLPTSLDEAVRNVQLLAGSTNDIGKSQKIFSALNNAIIGFGGNTEDVSASVIQLSEAFSGGVIDSSTWLSLIQNGLGPALNAMARSMNLPVGEFKKQLAEGTISVDQFQEALINMNEKGGAGMASFEDIAKDATAGVGTGWQNMQTAITRGIASIIEYIGQKNISNTLSSIGKGFEEGLKAIPPIIDIIKGFLTDLLTFFKPVTDFIANNKEAWDVLKTALLAIVVVIGLIIVAVGIGLVGAFAVVMGVINVAIFVVTKIIEAIVWLGDAIAGVIWWFVQADATVRSTMSNIYNNIGRTVLGVAAWFNQLNGKILEVFNNAGNWLYDIGKNIVGGLIKGIQDMVGQVQKVAGDIGKSIQDKFKNVMGIHSPSTVFATYGKYIAQGLSVGIDSNANLPNKSIGDMIGGLQVPSLSSSVGLSSFNTLDTSASNPNNSNITVNLNLSGIMARSKSDERDIAKSLIRTVNDELSAKGVEVIGGGNI